MNLSMCDCTLAYMRDVVFQQTGKTVKELKPAFDTALDRVSAIKYQCSDNNVFVGWLQLGSKSGNADVQIFYKSRLVATVIGTRPNMFVVCDQVNASDGDFTLAGWLATF